MGEKIYYWLGLLYISVLRPVMALVVGSRSQKDSHVVDTFSTYIPVLQWLSKRI